MLPSDELEEVVRVAKRMGERISLMPEGPTKNLMTEAIRRRVKEKYPRLDADLDAADDEESDGVCECSCSRSHRFEETVGRK